MIWQVVKVTRLMHATPAKAMESRFLTADRFNSAIRSDFQPPTPSVSNARELPWPSLKLSAAQRVTCLTFFSPTLIADPSPSRSARHGAEKPFPTPENNLNSTSSCDKIGEQERNSGSDWHHNRMGTIPQIQEAGALAHGAHIDRTVLDRPDLGRGTSSADPAAACR